MVEGSLRDRPDYGEVIRVVDAMADKKASHLMCLLAALALPITRTAALSKEREVRVDLKSLPDSIKSSVKPYVIEQGYLAESQDGDSILRVRKEQDPDGAVEYTMTAKNYPTYSEAETEIDQPIYDGLRGVVKKVERKQRYKWNGWDIDVITEGNRAGRIVAEFELPEDEVSVAIPDELKSVMVTGGKDGR
jgi:CYTH domain-containing protein